MEEHSGASFVNSCVKMPIDPFTRQPTPSYERPCTAAKSLSSDKSDKCSKTDENTTTPNDLITENCSPESVHDFLDFLDSIPDYGEVHHLSNEQFRQQLEYLKRKRTLLLTNLSNYLDEGDNGKKSTENCESEKGAKIKFRGNKKASRKKKKHDRNKEKRCSSSNNNNKLNLKGKRCNMEELGNSCPMLYSKGSFKDLTKDQDLLYYSGKVSEKDKKTSRNKEILFSGRSWSDGSDELKNNHCAESDTEFCSEVKNLPSFNPQKWHPTLPKPFTFTMRSRIIREESALNLLSQVQPFKLECEERAMRCLSRSSPELTTRKASSLKFKAKPVPKNLFNTDIYDKMLEDEYFRHLQKKMRAMELLKSSSLPPSMARREKVESSSLNSNDATPKMLKNEKSRRIRRPLYTSSSSSDRPKSSVLTRSNSGTNLAAILRCQASREKLEREIQERLAESERIHNEKIRQTLLARKPAWKALRIAARYDHERDLNYRTKLRQREAQEQAERHRLQMELMLDRVMRIPTLFERYSQNFQYYSQCIANLQRSRKGMKIKKPGTSSTESYASLGSSSTNSLRLNMASSMSSSETIMSSSNQSSNSSKSSKSSTVIQKPDVYKSNQCNQKKKNDRGTLKVSINENAELIEDKFDINCRIDELQQNDQQLKDNDNDQNKVNDNK